MSTLAPGYDPTTFESRLYQEWENSGVFQCKGEGPPYVILLPPPNVTGTLHMGHAFQHTLQDALIRYHRMRGYDTLWQMGTDHAGIATEMVVARNLGREGLTRDGLGRAAFIDKVWEWREQSGHTIERQMRRLGTSGDWSRSVFTMDPMAADAVVEAFVRLHENKDENGNPDPLIYRGQRLVNWDPVLKTAISDLEVVSEEEDGFLWSIAYPLSDGSGSLTVATTRPETMLGDTAVMVHPDDERYAHLIGRTVTLPLSGREIPVIADAYVDREFGTGVVKVTPAHDFNDYAVWKRHVDSGAFDGQPNRGLINILSPSARILHEPLGWVRSEKISTRNASYVGAPDVGSEHAHTPKQALEIAIQEGNAMETIPAKYRGLDRYEAREAVLADLLAAGLLLETKPHKLQVPRGDRSGQVIEPYLTDQWFVKMDGLARRGLDLVENGDVRFVPPNWINTYRHWMENIQDWCISRQLWWGHQIPAWYGTNGEPYVGRNLEEAREKAAAQGYQGQLTEQDRDNDVLETWFSSQLWPVSTMGWPDPDLMQQRGFEKYVPSSVLVTGFDIIFFWVARMIMATDHLTGRVPFRDVYITGLVRDKDGQKMSKSKGNIIDPLDIIDGISIDDLVAKRTTGLMQPKMAEQIERATRKEFPEGIPAFGADALRFTIAALAGHGRDIKFDLGRAEGYKNFCNKLWNATRFVLMNTEGFSASGPPMPRTDAERWVLHEFQHMLLHVEEGYTNYRFDLVAQALYEFAWNKFCDVFLELAKPALGGEDPEVADSTRHTLLFVLEQLLRALHPLIPFITEELWLHIAPKLGNLGATISLQQYPVFDVSWMNPTAASDIERFQSANTVLRELRSQTGVPPSKKVKLIIEGMPDDPGQIERYSPGLKFLSKLESIRQLDEGEQPPASMAMPIPGSAMVFHIPLEGLVDPATERARLDKELKRVESELAKSTHKLASGTFVQNAPAAVVEQERQRLVDWTAQRDALAAQRARLA